MLHPNCEISQFVKTGKIGKFAVVLFSGMSNFTIFLCGFYLNFGEMMKVSFNKNRCNYRL